MEWAILVTMLALVWSQEIKRDEAHTVEQTENVSGVENSFDASKRTPAGSNVFENVPSYGQDMKMQNDKKGINKKAAYNESPKSSKLKFRNYEPETMATKNKLTEPISTNAIDGDNMPVQLNKRDEKNNIDEHIDLGSEFEGVEVGDGTDGFSFKNLMPLWKPLDAIEKQNKKKTQKGSKKGNDKNEAKAGKPDKNQKTENANFLLFPSEQNKIFLIKALENDKNHFDNLPDDKFKVIQIDGKSDLKIDELMTGDGGNVKNNTNDANVADKSSPSLVGTNTKKTDAASKKLKKIKEKLKSGGSGGVNACENEKEKQKKIEAEKKRLQAVCENLAKSASKTTTTAPCTTSKMKMVKPINESPEMSENDLKEEILSCTAEKLEKYLKNLRNKCDRQQQHQQQQQQFERLQEVTDLPIRKLQTVHDSVQPRKEVNILDSVGADNDRLLEHMFKHLSDADLMRLNISINGLVMKDERPSHIQGNATINLKPSEMATSKDNRTRRGLKRFFSKSETKNKNYKDCCNDEDDSEDDIKCCNKNKDPSRNQINSIQISDAIMKMVSQMVRSNPDMKRLWPSLKRNRPFDQRQTVATMQKLCKGPERKHMEEMIRRALCSVDQIIEQEVQKRTCTSLPSDLQAFYESILSLHAKQAKRSEEREERLNKIASLDENNCDEEEKVKPPKPCEKTCDDEADLNANSLYDMMHERKLKFDNEMAEVRHSREAIRRNRDLKVETANSSLVRRLREGYSPAFLKLHQYADAVDRAATNGGGEVLLNN